MSACTTSVSETARKLSAHTHTHLPVIIHNALTPRRTFLRKLKKKYHEMAPELFYVQLRPISCASWVCSTSNSGKGKTKTKAHKATPSRLFIFTKRPWKTSADSSNSFFSSCSKATPMILCPFEPRGQTDKETTQETHKHTVVVQTSY